MVGSVKIYSITNDFCEPSTIQEGHRKSLKSLHVVTLQSHWISHKTIAATGIASCIITIFCVLKLKNIYDVRTTTLDYATAPVCDCSLPSSYPCTVVIIFMIFTNYTPVVEYGKSKHTADILWCRGSFWNHLHPTTHDFFYLGIYFFCEGWGCGFSELWR